MSTRRIGRTAVGLVAVLLAFVQAGIAGAQQVCCSGSACCGPPGDPCILEYGARGVVRDAITGLPIEGARIVVLDLAPVEADADGSFVTAGSRSDTCNLDYYYSITVTAPGYEPFGSDLYTNGVFPNFNVELRPSPGFAVSGFVAEFPECGGRMRGVTVSLEPLGLSTETALLPDGDTFLFEDVPPGDYVLSVVGCNPFGCWRDTPIRVTDGEVQSSICMDAFVPTPTATSTPSVSPTACAQPTAPLCPVGQEPSCSSDPCVTGCECVQCPPCPAGQNYTGEPNRCTCAPCPVATPCPKGQRRIEPCDQVCGLSCGCEIDPATETANTSSGGCAVAPRTMDVSAGLYLVLAALALSRVAKRTRIPTVSAGR